jgi:hypothetical protein
MVDGDKSGDGRGGLLRGFWVEREDTVSKNRIHHIYDASTVFSSPSSLIFVK